MHADCQRFAEECCASCSRQVQLGDIDGDGDDWLVYKVLMCLLSCGFLIFVRPDLFKFLPPPKSEIVRMSTQIRKVPNGYPRSPLANETMARNYRMIIEDDTMEDSDFTNYELRFRVLADLKMQSFFNLRAWTRSSEKTRQIQRKSVTLMQKVTKDRSFAEKMSAEQLNELWEPTFSSYERYICFWSSPMVLFMADCLVIPYPWVYFYRCFFAMCGSLLTYRCAFTF